MKKIFAVMLLLAFVIAPLAHALAEENVPQDTSNAQPLFGKQLETTGPLFCKYHKEITDALPKLERAVKNGAASAKEAAKSAKKASESAQLAADNAATGARSAIQEGMGDVTNAINSSSDAINSHTQAIYKSRMETYTNIKGIAGQGRINTIWIVVVVVVCSLLLAMLMIALRVRH